MWIWMGRNPAGDDWPLGSARLFTLEEALTQYARKWRRLANRAGGRPA